MKSQYWPLSIFLLIVLFLVSSASERHVFAVRGGNEWTNSQIARITAEELKEKLSRNEPVTILDVRGGDSYVASDNRIRGSIHVKLRRLSFRLSLPPLSRVPRDSEVVTYCACPGDEASIRAAEILQGAGFKRVRVLEGGWQMWLRAKGQVEPRPKA